MQGIGPADLKIDLLCERLERGEVKEVILAISTSVEWARRRFSTS